MKRIGDVHPQSTHTDGVARRSESARAFGRSRAAASDRDNHTTKQLGTKACTEATRILKELMDMVGQGINREQYKPSTTTNSNAGRHNMTVRL